MAKTHLTDANPDGTSLGQSATDLIGFYGKAPVAQRASAAMATSLVGTASSTAVDTNLKAALIEVMNTLNGIGLHKGTA